MTHMAGRVSLVEEIFPRRTPLVADVPIAAKQVLPLWVIRYLLSCVVEARARGIGLRVNLQNIQTERIEAVLWNLANDSAFLETAACVGSATGEPGCVITDEGERLATAVHALREVSRSLERRRHVHADGAV